MEKKRGNKYPELCIVSHCALLTLMERKINPVRQRMSTGQVRMCCCDGYHRTGIRFNAMPKHPLSPDERNETQVWSLR